MKLSAELVERGHAAQRLLGVGTVLDAGLVAAVGEQDDAGVAASSSSVLTSVTRLFTSANTLVRPSVVSTVLLMEGPP